MDFDKEKVEEMVLALLYLTTFEDGPNFENRPTLRAWKGHDWDILNGLHAKGYIDNPASKAKSVVLTEQGASFRKSCSRSIFQRVCHSHASRPSTPHQRVCHPERL